jgi:uncharacterized protein (TIGR03086 family)
MLNEEPAEPEQVTLYRRATAQAVTVVEAVEPAQLSLPTPCTEWTVQDLVDHLVAGTDYLVAAMEGRAPVAPAGTTPADFRRGVDAVLAGVAKPGALDRVCQSPLGFEWPVSQAVAGTFMDVLIHTWDLARATGQDETLDPALVEACVAMFLPDMPVRGRAAGILGPEVPVEPDASAQDHLLGAMGRRP